MKFKTAFSLVELLISIIIVSIFLTVFTPVLTKKLTRTSTPIIKNSSISSDCYKFNKGCMLCDTNKCIFCYNQQVPIDGQYVDPIDNCTIKDCPTNCIKCNGLKCYECAYGYRLTEQNICVEDNSR